MDHPAEPARFRQNEPTRDISRKLRAYYDSVRDEAIPDRLLDLLEKLDEVEKAGQTGLDEAKGRSE